MSITLTAAAAWLGNVGKNNRMFYIPMLFMLTATLTKKEKEAHGFGFQQMLRIAQKYDSTILRACINGDVFVAETALKMP